MSSKAKNDTAAAAGTTLLYHHLFGLDVGVTPSVMYVDETTLCYAAGHNVVMYNTDSHRQRVFSGLDNTKAVTALALAPRKNMIAIAERGDRALVSIYDTATGKRRKQLSTSEIGSTAIVSMDFSEHKTLVTMGGAPDWTLVLWAYDKGKVLATGKVSNANASPISRVSFCPFDHHVLCVSGETILKFFRVQDGVLKMLNPSLGKHEPINYQDHAWLPENRVVVTTDTGELRFYENYELKNEMATGEDSAIMCSVVGFSKGFICGGEGGQIRVFERSDDGRDPFKHAVTLDIGGRSSNARVVGMCISPSEETLVVTTDDNQMYLTQLANLDIVKSEDSSFTVMGTPLHAPSVSGTRTITGMDVCIRKPLIVTCGADKSVRVWNYLNKSMDLTAYFEEDPTSCAMHPSGLHVLVGFTDKLRLMNLLLDDIRPCREFSVKSCVDCTFSKGGHLFAATTGNAINIYDYYTFECIAQLRGHNQKVLRVQFENDERTLVSAGMDGSVIRWDITEGRRIAEFVQKGVVFTDVLPAPGGKVVTMGSDRLLKVIEFNPDNTGSATTEMDVDVQLGCVALTKSGKSLLAAGTDLGRPGTVRAYAFPLTGHYVEYQAHSGPVTRIRLSFDDQYCFTVGADGTLAAFNIREPAAGKGGKGARDDKRGAGGAHDALPFAEETLVTRSDLEEKKAKMAELHAKVDELQLHNEYQLRRKDIKYSEKIQEVTEKFTQELEAGRQKYDLLTEEKEDMRLEYTYKIESLEAKQTREIEEMQRNYKGKIDAEVSRYNELEEERDRLNREWDEKNEMVVESHQTYIQDLTESYEQKLRQEEEERQRIAEQKELLMRGFAERKKSIDDDADREIEDYKRKYELKVSSRALMVPVPSSPT
jgi:WD40 repeat protein